MNELLEALQCPECKGRNFTLGEGGIKCGGCSQLFPIKHGVVDAMCHPSTEVVREIQGMMHEHNEHSADYREFIVRHIDKVSSFEDRKRETANHAFDYYGSTELNLQQALAYVNIRGDEKVLEVGGHSDCPFLRPFRDKGCTCFETNIYFVMDDSDQLRNWPYKVVGDMNQLPYRDGYFDIVLASATTHHSPSLEATIQEFARVTKPGGMILIINEPTRALLKHSWDMFRSGFRKGGIRNDLIHENEYSVGHYRRLFRQNNLTLVASLFSAYYDQRLSSGKVDGVRFSPLAKLGAKLWKIPPVRKGVMRFGLRAGQGLIGFQMNVVVRKKGGSS